MIRGDRWTNGPTKIVVIWIFMTGLLGLCGCHQENSSEPRVQKSQEAESEVQVQQRPASQAGALGVGDPAPGFSAVAHTGESIQLSQFRDQVVVLYFYPKDGTPGCTTEAKQFSAQHQSLEESGAVVLGVSADDNRSHRRFAEEHSLPFLLLPDTEREIAQAYGVGSFLGMTKRVTYLIDREGKIAKIYPSVSPKEHAEQILRDIERLEP